MDVAFRDERVLEAKNITKRFGHVLANQDVSIFLRKGEILAVLGENGAGKSTLMHILFGLFRPTSGSIFLHGKPVSFQSPREAIAAGLGMVHQHFMLVPTLSVTQNIILGHEPLRFGQVHYRQARAAVQALSVQYGLEVDPDARVEGLPVGLQQRVEILKALYRNAQILILDEPTAVLSPKEVEELFTVLRRLAEHGTSIIIITHKLGEALAISHRICVLRRGKLVAEMETSEATPQELAYQMVGRPVVLTVEKKKTESSAKDVVLSLEHLSVRSVRGNMALTDVNLAVKRGEILGIAGVEGNGQHELCQAIVGLYRVESGSITFKGQKVNHWSIRQRILAGMGYIPQDRHGSGLILPFTVAENLMLGRSDRLPLCRYGFLDESELHAMAVKLMEQYDIRAESCNARVATLSGGNQQKVILAREFSRLPDFLLISQPTRGLDVGATEYIYRRIGELSAQGVGILLISMELEELFAIADSIAVLHRGEVVFQRPAGETNEIEVGEFMFRGREARRAL